MAEDYQGSGFTEGLIRQNPEAETQYDNVSVESLLSDNAINSNKVLELDFAKITNVEIENAQIVNVSATKITAGTITSESIVLAADGSGDSTIRAGKTDFDNSVAGFILGIDDSDSDKPKFYIGDATNYLNWTGSALNIRGVLNADDIVAGTLTGRTVKAIGGGVSSDVWVDGALGAIRFRYNSTDIATLYCDTSGRILFTTTQTMYLTADSDWFAHGESITMESDDAFIVVFNADGGSDEFNWINDTDLDMQLQDDGDLSLPNGSYT